MAARTPCSTTPRRDSYERRRPDETLSYQLIEEHWPTFLERAEQSGGLPDFIVEKFGAYLRCGMLEHGLAHFACRQCGESLAVAFSCKTRGFCPSCTGRRMADVAAHLVDEVFPEVPVRQWVCSLPWRLRYAMGYARKLCADVLDAFITSLCRSLRRRAKSQLGLRSVEDALFGAVTFIQRADSSLRLNVHFHCLVLDGVYVRDDDGGLRFHELGAPNHEEITNVARWTHERLGRVMERHGRSLDEGAPDDGAADLLAREQPVLASCYEASTADRQLLGDAPGQQTRKLAHVVRELAKPNDALAEVGGVNVHAGAAVPSRDRQRLERLCRYVARPPIAQERLELTADGRCRYDFRHAWKNSTTLVPTSSRTTSRHSPLATERPSVITSYSATRPGNALASSCIRSARSLHLASRLPKSVASTCTRVRRSTVEIVDGSSRS